MASQSLRPEGLPARSLADVVVAVGGHLVGERDAPITGVSLDTSEIRPGDLFVAVKGSSRHGVEFLDEAKARGAVAVLTDPAGRERAREGTLPVAVHDAPRTVVGECARLIYDPGMALPRVLAVTGTNGKTSTAFFMAHIVEKMGTVSALSTTAERRIAGQSYYTRLTTPEAPELQAFLSLSAQRGVRVVSLEASAQAIERHRLGGMRVAVAGFTNLSHDHLEDYGDMDTYLLAKAALFRPELSDRGVVSLDSPWGEDLRRRASIPVVTLQDEEVNLGQARPEWTFRTTGVEDDRTLFTLRGPSGELSSSIPGMGQHMVHNAALAVAMVVESGEDWEKITQAIDVRHGGIDFVVPGRLEKVSGDSRLSIYVDAGRSEDAYRRTLQTLRQRTQGALIMVCGTSGNRDESKRPLMGEAAATYADRVIITDDDPRFEDPARIRSALLGGARSVPGATVEEVPNPTDAIRRAVESARPGDVIVWSGPGSQSYREIRGERVPFSARDEATLALREAGWLS